LRRNTWEKIWKSKLSSSILNSATVHHRRLGRFGPAPDASRVYNMDFLSLVNFLKQRQWPQSTIMNSSVAKNVVFQIGNFGVLFVLDSRPSPLPLHHNARDLPSFPIGQHKGAKLRALIFHHSLSNQPGISNTSATLSVDNI